jgi:hypothetical protein
MSGNAMMCMTPVHWLDLDAPLPVIFMWVLRWCVIYNTMGLHFLWSTDIFSSVLCRRMR